LQSSALEEPTTLLDVPAAHSMQLVAPTTELEYVPAGQSAQDVDAGAEE
jgi:hypothetical protein